MQKPKRFFLYSSILCRITPPTRFIVTGVTRQVVYSSPLTRTARISLAAVSELCVVQFESMLNTLVQFGDCQCSCDCHQRSCWSSCHLRNIRKNV